MLRAKSERSGAKAAVAAGAHRCRMLPQWRRVDRRTAERRWRRAADSRRRGKLKGGDAPQFALTLQSCIRGDE